VVRSATYLLFPRRAAAQPPCLLHESNFHCDSEACLDAMERYDFGFVSRSSHHAGARGSLTALTQEIQHVPAVSVVRADGIRQEVSQRRRARDPDPEDPGDSTTTSAGSCPSDAAASFWKFQRDKLAALAIPLSRTRLAAHARPMR